MNKNMELSDTQPEGMKCRSLVYISQAILDKGQSQAIHRDVERDSEINSNTQKCVKSSQTSCWPKRRSNSLVCECRQNSQRCSKCHLPTLGSCQVNP